MLIYISLFWNVLNDDVECLYLVQFFLYGYTVENQSTSLHIFEQHIIRMKFMMLYWVPPTSPWQHWQSPQAVKGR